MEGVRCQSRAVQEIAAHQKWNIRIFEKNGSLDANLENGLVTGVLIFLAGFGFSIYAVLTWHANHFGPLNTGQMLRLTLPAAAAMTLGVQIAVSSFFLGLLRLGKR